MAGSLRLGLAGEPAQPGGRSRPPAVILALTGTALTLILVEFALAGFGAFTMAKTPTDNAYGAHRLLGLVIAALTLLILAAVLASRPARAHPRTRWLAVTLAVLSVLVQPTLGYTGSHVPVVGVLHALNALAVLAVTSWLTWEVVRRRAVHQPTRTDTTSSGKHDAGAGVDLR
jgi:heme A synthase